MDAPVIVIDGARKRFPAPEGGFIHALRDVSLEVGANEFITLLGPSGCGKTTLLRAVSGFEDLDAGSIAIDGRPMRHVPPYRRPVNTVFQNYALFPHMTVERNVAYGLQRDGVPRAEIAQRVEEMLAMVELAPFARRKPHQLSGGQRQRVALARSLVKRPKALLLDEPLGALDKRLREQTQFELMNIQDRLGITFVVVTHDQEEAMTLSTRIAVMDAGRFVQIGTPTAIYEFPETRFIANFVGSANMFEGRVTEDGADHVRVRAVGHDAEFYIDHGVSIKKNSTVWIAIRPEKISLSKTPPAEPGPNRLKGVVSNIGYLGGLSIYRVALDGGRVVEVTLPNQKRPESDELALDWDDEVHLSWQPSSAVVLTK